MKPFTRRNNRRSKPLPSSVTHFPTATGYWVQWSGRTDWQPVDVKTGEWLREILGGEGDRVVWVEREGVKA
jgi:hypothetical protein